MDVVDLDLGLDCLTGPDAGPAASGCDPLDLDADDDVDLLDLAYFQILLDAASPPLDPPATVAGTLA